MKNGRILLIEKDNVIINLITYLLKKNGFDDLVVVSNKVDILNQVKNGEFDLILVEIMLSGFKVVKEIRQIYNNIPIISVTTVALSGDKERCFEAGVTDYISKPFKNTEFISMVKSHININ